VKSLHTAHGDLALPAFLPDATRAVVRTLDASDLAACGVEGVMVNALHLSSRPGTSLITSLGGVHRLMGWSGPVFSDSGGFQVYSLVAASPKAGGISERGVTYRLEGGEKRLLTPEKCVQRQFQIGADVMFCLDHCTHPDDRGEAQRESVEHTVAWARRCKEAFVRRLEERPPEGRPPLLFAVVQGGRDRDLRRACAERLLEMGFDGYGFGGWPIDEEGGIEEAVGYVAELIPEGVPRHALGIGKPENLLRAFRTGYDLFDCALPTRDARRKRLYVFNGGPGEVPLKGDAFYHYLYIEDERYARDSRPLDEGCGCLCCRRYSRAYLRHLFEIDDALAHRLATMHNLTFYCAMMRRLREERREA
jgi:queuine tRNA-ribosyltransferase